MHGKPAPKCPRCGTNKHVRPHGVVGDLYRCGKCSGTFDDDPEEGGDYSDRNPAARLERDDRRRFKGRK